MKIKIISKPEGKKTKENKPYYAFLAEDGGMKKKGNFFPTDITFVPEIDTEIEVEEKYNEAYKNYTWFQKSEKKQAGFFSKPAVPVEVQIRLMALQEAIRAYAELPDKTNIKIFDIAQKYLKFLKEGV